MAARLINRNMSIPGGVRFYIASLKWKSPRGASFNGIVDALQRVLQANPAAAQKLGWSLDWNSLADRVDEFNARICAAQGWDNYILQPEAGGIPKAEPPQQAAALASLRNAAATAKELLAGAKTLIEWLQSGDQPVSQELAEHRAIVCSKCPKNLKGDFSRWFSLPASELIRKQIEEASSRKLSTSRDEQLNLCDVCKCPLRLKVWAPINWIGKRLSVPVLDKLKAVEGCWIPGELDRQTKVG